MSPQVLHPLPITEMQRRAREHEGDIEGLRQSGQDGERRSGPGPEQRSMRGSFDEVSFLPDKSAHGHKWRPNQTDISVLLLLSRDPIEILKQMHGQRDQAILVRSV